MLSDQSLIEILGDWSFWDNVPPSGWTRQLTLPKQSTIRFSLNYSRSSPLREINLIVSITKTL